MTIIQPYSFWPQTNFWRAARYSLNFPGTNRIEVLLQDMFPSGHPVLLSSGRSALAMALLSIGLRRHDKVNTFPYASHCVLDAISRVSTPTDRRRNVNLTVLLHQWGYLHHTDSSSLILEDAVDSLVPKGSQLFQCGGMFELWSLPKILGTTSGAILWCNTFESAERIRQIRRSKSHSTILWSLRLLGYYSRFLYSCWSGAETTQGRPSPFQNGEIIAALKHWDDIVNDRRQKLNAVWPLAPRWLAKPMERLPCVVPVELICNRRGNAKSASLGLTSGLRHFSRTGSLQAEDMAPVLPIPIHQGIQLSELLRITSELSPEIKR